MSFGPTALAGFRAAVGPLGIQATYQQGAQSIEPLDAIHSVKSYQVIDGDGLNTDWSSHDFIVAAEDLVIAAVAVRPERGDTIAYTVAGRTRTFSVQHPSQNDPPFRFSDSDGAVLRIHTILVSDVAA